MESTMESFFVGNSHKWPSMIGFKAGEMKIVLFFETFDLLYKYSSG